MYILRSKTNQNAKMKTVDDMDGLKDSDFDAYDVFDAIPVNKQTFIQYQKSQQVESLLGKLKELGVDLDALKGVSPSGNATPETTSKAPEPDKFVQIPAFAEEHGDAIEEGLQAAQMPEGVTRRTEAQMTSKIKKPGTEDFYTMAEIRARYDEFSQWADSRRDMPNYKFTEISDEAFVVHVAGQVPLPKVLKNGIPIRIVVD